MNDHLNQEKATDSLQELGLKEYEAKSFVALTRVPQATAKEISDISAVPRTRVYDAVSVLESKGLVKIQHSKPKRFRATSIDVAVETLRRKYDDRLESLREHLQNLSPADVETGDDAPLAVWAISGTEAITTRTQQLIEEADREVVLVLGDDSLLDGNLVATLRGAHERGVDIILGTISEELRAHAQDTLPDSDVFVTGIEWLDTGGMPGDETEIGRLLIVDRETLLTSTFTRGAEDQRKHEQAAFGEGFDNGFVTVARRLMVTGLLPGTDPGEAM